MITYRHSLQSSRRLCLLLLIVTLPLVWGAAEQGDRVETSDLVKTPQKYWTRSIQFKDTLTEPPENITVDIEGKRYVAFSAREVGVCYASADLLPALLDLDMTCAYLFAGTVYFYHGRYVPIVRSYTPAVDIHELATDVKQVLKKEHDDVPSRPLRPMSDLLAAVQSTQLAYAKQKNIPLNQLFDPTSEHFRHVMDLALTAISNTVGQSNTSLAEILAQYLTTVVAERCATVDATQTVTAAESESASPTTTNKVPEKLSWSERWMKVREKKMSELKEKNERDTTTAAENQPPRKEDHRPPIIASDTNSSPE